VEEGSGVAVCLAESGGHSADFPGRRIFPSPFVLRHYIALSRAHAIAKYAGRVYAAAAVERGWHKLRATFAPERLRFPPRERLKRRDVSKAWDRSDPWHRHEIFGAPPPTAIQAPISHGSSASAAWPSAAFVVGVQHSGTTLLGSMLNAHPELSTLPETHFIPAVLALHSHGDDLRREFFAVVTGAHSWPDLRVPSEVFQRALFEIRRFDLASGLRCFYRLCANRFGKIRWGDETPSYTNYLRVIHEVLPEARFIHVIRDARDVALSSRDHWFGSVADLEGEASNWVWQIREARYQAQAVRQYLEIRYEDLIADPQLVLQGVCRFLELRYDPVMESSHPEPSRIGRWRTEMSGEERRRFEAVAGDMLRDLGYPC
jgi:hypothetical protein